MKHFINALAILFIITLGLALPSKAQTPDIVYKTPMLRVVAIHDNYVTTHDIDNRADINYMNKVRGFLNKTGLDYEFIGLPGKRAYRELTSRDDTLHICLGRNKERENNFHWLLVTFDFVDHLITLNTPELNNLTKEQVIAGDYKVICSRDYAQCNLLIDLGFSKDRLVEVSGLSVWEQAHLLLKGRADFIFMNFDELTKQSKKLNLDINKLTPLFSVKAMKGYLAGPKTMNPLLLDKLLKVAQSK